MSSRLQNKCAGSKGPASPGPDNDQELWDYCRGTWLFPFSLSPFSLLLFATDSSVSSLEGERIFFFKVQISLNKENPPGSHLAPTNTSGLLGKRGVSLIAASVSSQANVHGHLCVCVFKCHFEFPLLQKPAESPQDIKHKFPLLGRQPCESKLLPFSTFQKEKRSLRCVR